MSDIYYDKLAAWVISDLFRLNPCPLISFPDWPARSRRPFVLLHPPCVYATAPWVIRSLQTTPDTLKVNQSLVGLVWCPRTSQTNPQLNFSAIFGELHCSLNFLCVELLKRLNMQNKKLQLAKPNNCVLHSSIQICVVITLVLSTSQLFQMIIFTKWSDRKKIKTCKSYMALP